MIEGLGLGIVLQILDPLDHAVEAEGLHEVEGGMVEHEAFLHFQWKYWEPRTFGWSMTGPSSVGC